MTSGVSHSELMEGATVTMSKCGTSSPPLSVQCTDAGGLLSTSGNAMSHSVGNECHMTNEHLVG